MVSTIVPQYEHLVRRVRQKRLHFCTTNLPRTMCIKFYHNQSGVVDCISKNVLDQKTFWCVFSAHSVVTNKSNILK